MWWAPTALDEISDVAIARGLVTKDQLRRWIPAAATYVGSAPRDPNNPVAVPFDPEAQPVLSEIARSQALIQAMRLVYPNKSIGLYNERLLSKTKDSWAEVFVHQDCGYHQGFLDKWSAFVALSHCCVRNGGLRVYPGTSKFGYLGDAGEIHPDLLNARSSFTPTLEAGDVLFMHSSVWHGSEPFKSGPPRLLADIIFQPATDPTTRLVLHGFAKPKCQYSKAMRDHPLVNGRVQKIQRLQRALDERKENEV